MKQIFLYTFLITLLQGINSHVAFSQKSTAEELKEANKLFEEGNFREAGPLFLKKLSVDQKSGEYNFKYGTCILHTDGDKRQGLRYLKFASQIEGTDSRVWFYLGKAYHLNYMFADAVKSYNKFITLNPKDKEKYQVQKEIDACNFGKTLLKHITEVQVVSRNEFNESNFFYNYKLQGIGGQMALISALQSELDKKKKHNVIVYFPNAKSSNSTIFYSSYGKDGKTGKDIYKVNRLPDGSFGTPQIVNGPINTSLDEDFPYMHPDGRTFYFASTGHNSMGGYDIFRCYYDSETDQFSAPENVDFAINTPGDDYLYVTDSSEKMAYFASTRESPSGKINVYNVFVDRLPINIAILKGNFINEINETYLAATITIEDVATNEVIGIFNTNRNNGSYLITLPKGGKYKFSVLAESQVVHTGIVEVPPSKELRPLKQELVLIKEENKEILKIRNLFDEQFENVDEILAEVFLGQAKLDPNADINDTTLNAKVDKSDSLDIKADEDVLAVAKKDADLLQTDYEEAKLKMEGAYAFAAKKQMEAKEKSDRANDLIKEAGQTSNEDEKEQLIKAAAELNEDAAKDNAMAVAGFNLGKGIESDVEQKKKDANIAREFEKGIEKAVNAKNHNEVIAELKKQQEFVKTVMGANSENKNNEDQLRTASSEKRNEVEKLKIRLDDYRESENALLNEIASLEKELKDSNTKKDRKKAIETELQGKKSELSDTQTQIAANDKKYKQLIGEQNELDQQLSVISGISDVGSSLTQVEKDKLAKDMTENSVASAIEKNKSEINAQQDQNRTDRENNQDFLAKNSNYKELNKKKNDAENNPDKKMGLAEEKKINEEIINELGKIENDLTQKLNSETDTEKKNEITKQIEEVKKIKEERTNENAEIEKDLAKLNENTVVTTNNNALEENSNYNELNKKKNDAENNPDKKMGLAEEKKINEEIINELGKIENDLTQKLNSETDTEKKNEITKQIAEVKKIKEERTNENAEIEKDLAKLNENTVTTSEKVILTDDRKTELSNEKLPGYDQEMNKINSSSDSQKDKLLDKVDLNDRLIKNADDRIVQIDKELNKLTGDEKLKSQKEREELIQLKDKVENENNIHESEIARIEKEENTTTVSTNDFTVDNKEKIKEVDSTYDAKLNEIKNSTDSELKKEVEIKKTNENLLTEIEKKENKILTDPTLTDSEKEKQLSELKVLKEKTEVEIKKSEDELNEKGLKTIPIETTELESAEYADPNAQKDAIAIEKKMDVIESKENSLERLYVESAETTDPNKKKELDKKIATEEKSYYSEINKVAPAIEKVNNTEYVSTDKNVEKTKKDIFRNGNLDENNPKYKNAVIAEQNSERTKKEAEQLRADAKKESDPMKKADLNSQASAKEKEAIELSKEAEKLFAEYKNEMPVVAVNSSQNFTEEKKETLNNVDPEYLNEVAKIENSTDSKEEKNIRKNELNENLLKNIEKEELKVKTDFNKTPEQKKEKLEQLNTIKNETNREMEKTSEELKEAGIPDPRNSDVKYESVNYNSTEANKEVEDVKKDLTDLANMKKEADEARMNYVTIEDEKLKKLAKGDLDRKNQAIAKKELSVNDDLKAANDKEWEKANQDYTNRKNNSANFSSPNEERKIAAENLEREAQENKYDATQKRMDATKEKDPLKKADLLRDAHNLETSAIEKIRVASDLMNRYIADSMTAKVSTETKDKDGNIVIPEDVEERNSSQARKLATQERRIADSLNNVAAEFDKKAEKGNKKSKEENKKAAEQARNDANVHQDIANSLNKKANEDQQKEEVLLIEQNKRKEIETIRLEKKETVKALPEYVEYYDKKKLADDKKAAGDKAKLEAEQQQIIADNTRKEAQNTKDLAANELEADRKTQLEKTANDLDKKANKAERSADSLTRLAEKMYVESSGFNWDVENYLTKIDSKKAEDIRLATADGKLPDPDRSVVKTTDPTNKEFIIPTIVNSDVFAKVETPIYSDANPIPINPKTPNGAYLKVQVGAFRNPIKPTLYSQFAPVTGEARGDGLTRYTVGYFTTLESAIKARDEIRAMGYKDAFVVGFDDGKKTNVADVLAKIDNGNNSNPTNPTNITNSTNPTNLTNLTNPTNITNLTNTSVATNTTNPSNDELVKTNVMDEKKDDYYTGTPNAAKANQIEVIQGLFFTVQVGVYSKPVTPDKIFNLSPLNSELITRNNWIRYTTGIYTTFDKADLRKGEIRNLGVKDAFVVAYINGNKITPEKGLELLKEYGDSILVKLDANGNPLKGTNTNTTGNVNTAGNSTLENTVTNNGGNQITPTVETRKYKIILGEYANDVPANDAQVYMTSSGDGIKRNTDSNGKTIFYIENIEGKEKTDQLINKYKEKGLKGVKIDDGSTTSTNTTNPTNTTELSDKKMKDVDGLVFQVYIGEYVNELPEKVTAIILNNMSKGIKRKDSPTNSTIYFTGDHKSYEKATQDKSFFIEEGITTVKIVGYYQSKEISEEEAIKLMYE